MNSWGKAVGSNPSGADNQMRSGAQRRRMTAWSAATLALVSGVWPAAGAVRQGQPPNVVLIVADDLGWGDIHRYGNLEIKTPRLDALAGQGILFHRYYTCASVCSPARAAMLTGMFPAKLGIHRQIGAPSSANSEVGQVDFLDPAVQTLPELLQAAGYATGHYGKWHLGVVNAPLLGDYGFDEHRSYLSRGANPQYAIASESWRWTSSQQIVDDGIAFIQAHQAESFYLNLWLAQPHSSQDPTAEQAAPYAGAVVGNSVNGWTSARHCYYSAVTELDAQVGRFLDELEALALSSDTIVIFTSDNGPETPFSAEADHCGAGSTGPFRGRKGSIYEGGVLAPFFVRWPSVIPEGAIDGTSTIAAVDLLPTICTLVGVTYAETDGEDASSALLGFPWERSKDLYLEWRFGPRTRQQWVGDVSPGGAIISGWWKLLRNRDGSRMELYDLLTDPMEADNLVNSEPGIAQDLEVRLTAWQGALGACVGCDEEGGNAYPWP